MVRALAVEQLVQPACNCWKRMPIIARANARTLGLTSTADCGPPPLHWGILTWLGQSCGAVVASLPRVPEAMPPTDTARA
jgi:hypothetical protein